MIKQARIVPRAGYYVVEIVYEQAEAAPSGNPALYAAVDLGVDTLAALTSNKVGFAPRLVNGRVLKSYNQFYNKRRAELQAALGHAGTTARMERLTTKRTRRINHYLHAASKTIIALLVEEGIGTLVIGKNLLWKQEVELGRGSTISTLSRYRMPASSRCSTTKRNWQASASSCRKKATPARRPSWIWIRCRSMTPSGKTSHVFSGKREQRGLYRAKNGRRIQADVNGTYNIGRKAFPNSFGQGIEAVMAVRPGGLPISPVIPSRARERAAILPTGA